MIPVFLTLGGGALALIYLIRFAGAAPSGAKSVVKVGSVGALVLAAPLLGAPWAIALGLALGALGDFWLSRRGEAALLAGMAAFGLGHLAYTAAFWQAGAGGPGLLGAGALGALGLWAMAWLAPRAGGLKWPVRCYIAIILAMAAQASGLPGHTLARIGAAAFVASDLILALEMFVLPEGGLRRAAQRGLWALYWGAQAAILWGMA